MIALSLLFVLAAAAADKPPSAIPAGNPPETFQSAMARQRAAMVIQRESVRKQIEMAAQWHGAESASSAVPATGGGDTAPPGAATARESADNAAAGAGTAAPVANIACDPIADVELTPLIDGAAQGNQVQDRLLRGVIRQESANRPCAVSVKGAKGLMQLMPATMEQFQVDDPFDAKQNIEAGAKYLKQLLDRYKGDIKLALAAYNAGPGAVDKTGAIPEIKETKDYVEAIMKNLQ